MATQADLHGKVVVITGASSGFGRGAALEFASAGASVVLAARRGEALDTVARECETAGGTAIPVSVDVSSERDVEQLAQTAISQCGRIDVWINNVGLSDSLRQEVKQNHIDGVHICTILPTAHDTPFFDHAANYTGHEVTPPKPLHDPQNVIDAIVDVARDPDDERIVGADGLLKVTMANLMPGTTEKVEAKMMHKTQFEKAPPGADSPGAVERPTARGTAVDMNRRKQQKAAPRAKE